MNKNKNERSVHAGHRERMLKKYDKLGADAFEAHELLEMLLYFSISRHNTNEQAHHITDSFDSVEKVFSAKTDALTQINGIGEKSARLISLCRDCFRNLELSHSVKTPFDTNFKRSRYIYNWYKGKTVGTVMAMFLDEKLMFLESLTVSAGKMFRAESYPELILQKAISLKAKFVIISHSHSNNCTNPSVEDILLAGQIRTALGAHGIELINQYIVTEFDCIPTNNFNN